MTGCYQSHMPFSKHQNRLIRSYGRLRKSPNQKLEESPYQTIPWPLSSILSTHSSAFSSPPPSGTNTCRASLSGPGFGSLAAFLLFVAMFHHCKQDFVTSIAHAARARKHRTLSSANHEPCHQPELRLRARGPATQPSPPPRSSGGQRPRRRAHAADTPRRTQYGRQHSRRETSTRTWYPYLKSSSY